MRLKPFEQDFKAASYIKELNYKVLDRSLYHLSQAVYKLKKDILAQLQNNPSFTHQTRESIFDAYNDFCHHKNYSQVIETNKGFWDGLQNSIEIQSLSDFIDQYSTKIAIILLMKQKLLCQVAKEKELPIFDAYYINLNTFFSKIFPSGGSSQVCLKCFELNAYTWYQPNLFLTAMMKKVAVTNEKTSWDIYLNLLTKLLNTKAESEYEADWEANFLQFASQYGSYFSLENLKRLQISEYKLKSNISSLKSLYRSKMNYYFKFDDKFLTTLSQITFLMKNFENDNFESIQLFKSSQSDSFLTQSENTEKGSELLFVQHKGSLNSLLNHLNEQKHDTPVFIVTKTPIFTPSSREKTKNLLEVFDIKAHFNFTSLSNVNQSFNHVYIGKKTIKKPKQTSHYHLRFKAELNHKKDFSLLENLVKVFIDKYSSRYPMAYSAREASKSYYFDFFQDAIIDGLLMSASQGQNQLTHPNFFNGITQKCIPLETLFKTTPIDPECGKDHSPLLGSTRNLPEYVLVIQSGFSKNYQTYIDIIPGSSFLGHVKEHGQVENQYFALIPKQPDLNISVLKTFLKSSIGRQITELCFAGNHHHRTKLKTLLVPRFIGDLERVPSQTLEQLDFLKIQMPELQDISPQILFAKVKKNQLLLEQIFERYPLTTLSHIEHFHYRIQKLMGQKDSKANHHVNFYQPQLITELKSLKTQPIFPRHDDVYIDFNLGVSELALEMTSFQVKQVDDELYHIHIYNQERKVLTLHTKKHLSLFLEFLLKQMKDFPIQKVLKSMNIPSEESLAMILPSYSIDYSVIIELGLKCETLMEQLLRRFIINQ